MEEILQIYFVRNPYTHAISHWMFDEENCQLLIKKVINKKRFTKKIL